MMNNLIEAPTVLTVRTINDFAEKLRSQIDVLSDAKLSFEHCEELDLSALQLVEAARVHATAFGKSLTLLEPARGPLRDLLGRAGFLTDLTAADTDFWFHGECPQ